MTETCFYWKKQIPVDKPDSEAVPFEFENDLGVSFQLRYECKIITNGRGHCSRYMISVYLIDWNLGAFQFKNLFCSIETEPKEARRNCMVFEREDRLLTELSKELVLDKLPFTSEWPIS